MNNTTHTLQVLNVRYIWHDRWPGVSRDPSREQNEVVWIGVFLWCLYSKFNFRVINATHLGPSSLKRLVSQELRIHASLVVHVQTLEKWTFCIVLCKLLSNIFIVLCEVLPDSFVKETVHQVDFKHDSKQMSSECSDHPCIKSWLLCSNEKLTN